MTDDPGPVDDASSADTSGADLLLLAMVSAADKLEGESLGLTLSVDGVVVTGQLVGAATWFRRLGDDYPDILGDFMDEMHEDYRQVDPDERDPQDYEHIHLVKARYLLGSVAVPAQTSSPMHWRGRLSSVSGWSFGSMT